jgi:hypothetical protein
MQYLCCQLQIWLYQVFAIVANFHAISLAFYNGCLLYFGNINLDYCTARNNIFFQANTINVNYFTFKYILQTLVKTLFIIKCYKIRQTVLLDIVHVDRHVWTNLSSILYEGMTELSRPLCSHLNGKLLHQQGMMIINSRLKIVHWNNMLTATIQVHKGKGVP